MTTRLPPHVYPKRAIFRMLLLLAWERGEMRYSGGLVELLRAPW